MKLSVESRTHIHSFIFTTDGYLEIQEWKISNKNIHIFVSFRVLFIETKIIWLNDYNKPRIKTQYFSDFGSLYLFLNVYDLIMCIKLQQLNVSNVYM